MNENLREALRFDASRASDWVAWSLRALLLALALSAFVAPWPGSTGGGLAAYVLFGLAAAVGISALPKQRLWPVRAAESVWSLLFVFHFLGHALVLYDGWPPYDKVFHALSGVAAALVAYAFGEGTGWFWSRERPNRFVVFYTTFAAAVVGGVGVEILEFTSDQLLGTRAQTHPWLTPLVDTMTDLLAETATGALTGAALAWRTRPAPEAAARVERDQRDGARRASD